MARRTKSAKYLETMDYFARNKFNLLITGNHGVGKTLMVSETFNKYYGTQWAYFSGSTLDPHVDIGGIPYPGEDSNGGKLLSFLRCPRVWQAKAIFIDELPRSHVKVRNYIMEMVQFKTLNGEPLPNLELIWAGMNPVNTDMNYAGETLDPALMDRFHGFLHIEPVYSADILVKLGVKRETARALVAWARTLNAEQQVHIPPRRIEYIGKLWDTGGDISLAADQDMLNCKFPFAALEALLKGDVKGDDIEVTTGTMDVGWFVANHHAAIRMAQSDKADSIYSSIKRMQYDDVKKVSTILSALPKEMQHNIVSHFKTEIEADKDTSMFNKWANQVKSEMTGV